MKKLIFLIYIFLVASLMRTSCSDDDNYLAILVGRWIPTTLEAIHNGRTTIDDVYKHEEGCNKDYVEFTADGKFNDVWYSGIQCTMNIRSGTYTISGNTLTYTTDNLTQYDQIVLLTGTELKVKVTHDEWVNILTFIRAN